MTMQKKTRNNPNLCMAELHTAIPVEEKIVPLDLRKMITRKEVATYLNVKIQTVINYTKRGLLTAYKIGHRVLYNENEVVEALASGQVTRYQHESTRQYIFKRS